jgi:hypothetical protein
MKWKLRECGFMDKNPYSIGLTQSLCGHEIWQHGKQLLAWHNSLS